MSAQAHTLAFAAMLMLAAAGACAEADVLFPPVTAVRLERGYPQLAQEEKQAPPTEGDRLINLRVIVTFADAGKHGVLKRYANGLYDLLRCSADVCDANNYKVERQADGTVLLRMTGGLYIGGGAYPDFANRHLPDGHVYRLIA